MFFNPTPDFDRAGFEAWYEKRKGGITASELAAARRVNRYQLTDAKLKLLVNKEWNRWVAKKIGAQAPYANCIKTPGSSDEWPEI